MTETETANPFAGIESPFFWPVGLAMQMNEETLANAGKNLRFFQEIVKTDVMKPKPEWASPHRVMCDLHTCTLLNFSRHDAVEGEIPTLVLPPYAGHTSTIADFDKGQSLVETLLNNGVTRVYAIDWRSATPTMKDYDIDNYLAELHVVIGELGGRVKLIGLCQGGWMASLYAARFPQQVVALVAAGSPLDTQAGSGGVRELADTLPMEFYENLVVAGGGVLKGQYMLEGFKGMHPEVHMYKKYVDLYQNIDDPEFLQRNEHFSRWYEYTINLPGRWYLQVIKELFKGNRFAKGDFIALGRQVSPASITCPLYLLAGERDDITPPDQVFNATNFFGTPADKVVKEMTKGGHIGLFMGTHALRTSWPRIAEWLRTAA